MKILITSSLIIGAVFLLGASTSSNAIDTPPLAQHDSNIVKVHGHGGHGGFGHHGGGYGHHGHHGWDGGWGGWGGGFYGGPGYYYGGPDYFYAEPGPGLCVGPLCVF